MRNAVLSLALILGTSSLGADLIEDPSTKTANVLTLELEGRLVRIYTTRNIDELQKYLQEFKGPSATYDDLIRALQSLPEDDEESVLRELPPCPPPPKDLAEPQSTNPLQGSWVWVSILGSVLGMVGV